MALILCFHNDATGNEASANYDVEVVVGDGTRTGSRTIARGRIEGHNRKDGWERLVMEYLLQRPWNDTRGQE